MDNNMMSPADFAAMNRCNDRGDNLFGSNSLLAIIVLFLLFGMMGGNGFGWGNNAAAQGMLTRAEMFDGFNMAEVQRNQGDLMRGQFDVQREVLQNRFDASKCCCETQKEILESRYTTQLGFQNLQAAINNGNCATQKEILQSRYDTQMGFANAQHHADQCCCELKTAIHAEAEATRALINQNTMQELRDNLQAAQLQLGNLSQTQTLLAALQPTPRPAYPVASPYAVWQGAHYNRGGCDPCCGF